MLQDDKKMTLMSANDEQNGDDAKMMKRRTQEKQETQGKPGDYAQPHADWLLAAPTIIFMYLYKYLFKGPDRSNFALAWGQPQSQPDDADERNELDDYINGRYLSASEAAWRILAFDITRKSS